MTGERTGEAPSATAARTAPITSGTASTPTLARAEQGPTGSAGDTGDSAAADTAVETARRVRASFVEHADGWPARGPFERKWV